MVVVFGSVYFKGFTSIEAAAEKSPERLKEKLCPTLMTPKEAERAKTSNVTPNNPQYM